MEGNEYLRERALQTIIVGAYFLLLNRFMDALDHRKRDRILIELENSGEKRTSGGDRRRAPYVLYFALLILTAMGL